MVTSVYVPFRQVSPIKTFKFAMFDYPHALLPWKLNRYSCRVLVGINCIALDQSELSNFVECTIKRVIVLVISNRILIFDFEITRSITPWIARHSVQLLLHVTRTLRRQPSRWKNSQCMYVVKNFDSLILKTWLFRIVGYTSSEVAVWLNCKWI